jgi:endo-1,4-beta-xylanase
MEWNTGKNLYIPVISSALILMFIAQAPAQLAEGHDKWFGCCIGSTIPDNFHEYWNQVTPENAGKWGSVETGPDYYQWGQLDNIYNYALDNGFPFRFHVLVWGKQQPTWWFTPLDSAAQAEEVEEWIRLCGERYPEADYVEVVNEPIERLPWEYYPSYYESIGGAGETGWDWVIWAFEKAREYFPDAKLLLNEYEILGGAKSITTYNSIVELLKERDLIDGVCAQGHSLENDNISGISARLDRLAETGLPIQITEYDVAIADDQEQLERYQEQFSLFWEHPSVEGVTLWGYTVGMWKADGILVREDGSERPALQWLRSYLSGSVVDPESKVAPKDFRLHPNYPNPFNPATTISYSLDNSSAVKLTIQNVQGQTVRTLVNTTQSAGEHSVLWDGMNSANQAVSSGIYLYRLETDSGVLQRKMMLIR